MLHRTLHKPAYAFAVFVCKHSVTLPFVHLRKSVRTIGFFTVSLKLFNNFVFVYSSFPVAVECLFPVLATIFVDTLGAHVVAEEHVFHNINEPRTSQMILNIFPRLSRTSSDLANVQLNQIVTDREKRNALLVVDFPKSRDIPRIERWRPIR